MGNSPLSSIKKRREVKQLREECEQLRAKLRLCTSKGRQCERRHSETTAVLHNILPEKIAQQTVTGQPVPEAELKKAGVLFADMVGWTSMCEHVTPKLLLSWIKVVFDHVDTLINEHHGILKIKVIGDCIMACSGVLPSELPSDDSSISDDWHHLPALLDFALHMQEFIATVKRPDNLGQYAQFRIGIHAGECIAGIMCRKVPHFDLFGTTVNLASRLEATGLPGCIQVSSEVYEATKHLFEYERRGTVHLKGFGRPIQTYILRGRKGRNGEEEESQRMLLPRAIKEPKLASF